MTPVAPCNFITRSVPATGWFGVANGKWAWAGAPPKNHGTVLIQH